MVPLRHRAGRETQVGQKSPGLTQTTRTGPSNWPLTSSLSVLTSLVEGGFWCSVCNMYKKTHTHTLVGGVETVLLGQWLEG